MRREGLKLIPRFRLGWLGGWWGHPSDGQPQKKSSMESGCVRGQCLRDVQGERSGGELGTRSVLGNELWNEREAWVLTVSQRFCPLQPPPSQRNVSALGQGLECTCRKSQGQS